MTLDNSIKYGIFSDLEMVAALLHVNKVCIRKGTDGVVFEIVALGNTIKLEINNLETCHISEEEMLDMIPKYQSGVKDRALPYHQIPSASEYARV